MDLLVIGSGLSGAIIAHNYAIRNKKVLILEKRGNIGGNVFDKKIKGITTQIYGPHIFHTDNERVVEFMSQFWTLNSFKNKVRASIKGHSIPIPFNFEGIDTFFSDQSDEIKQKLIKKYGQNSRVGILELLNQKDKQLQEVANFVYKNIFENYTTKMWGISPKEIDQSVMKRVPVVIGYDDRYFSNKYEGIPVGGFTSAVQKMLDHENIKLQLNIDAKEVLTIKDNQIFYQGQKINCPVIYTGPIDELFDYEHGVLNYRSLDIKFESINKSNFQKSGVVNYPDDPKMTRITEYKTLTQEQDHQKTIISKEFPGKFDLKSEKFNKPYYPMMTEESKKQYNIYKNKAQQVKNLFLVGRLATYQYLDMDVAIDKALSKFFEIYKGDNNG